MLQEAKLLKTGRSTCVDPQINLLLQCPHAPIIRAGKATNGLFVAPTSPIFVDQGPTFLAQQPNQVIAPNSLQLRQHPLAQPTSSRRSGHEDPRDNDSNITAYLLSHLLRDRHVNKRTTYTDPRLAFAHEDCGRPDVISQRFDAYSSALGVLQGRDLSDKYAVVTGATTGIGFETARSLALHGVHVVIASHNLKSANTAAGKIKEELSLAEVSTMILDLASFRSVKEFADSYKLQGWQVIGLMRLMAAKKYPCMPAT
ncbi:WW domain-containing oxidoreductase-like [Asterias rubens]|uniref:WW domain-containing oxidoreductase-like n=1 Tax=Asterias rubens TaxID=7604 RepID=UPI0014557FA9|nr:WW domain-containing oxidoreductase-like [Asterias rubens]